MAADDIKDIRDEYDYLNRKWEDPRKERKIDMRYLMGDPWDPKDRKARDDAGRPCLNHDELRQYINQAINSVRQNKRGIKVDPDEATTTDKSAELRQDIIRTIEYKCGAPYIYISSGFEQMIRGGYGFYRIGRRYKDDTFDQEILIKPLLNPDAVLYDWDCREVDWSDARTVFVLDWMTKKDFERRFKNSQAVNFAGYMREAKSWFHEDKVLVAERWKIESKFKPLYKLEGGQIVDKKTPGMQIVAEREYEEKQVVQYITNGVEVIKRIPQPGHHIPIIPNIGEELWVDEGSGSERKILSMVRLARDPQMSLAYLVSQEAEEAKLTPKAPYMGYKGQFESDAEAWERLTSDPRAYVQVDPVVDGATGQVLPLPRREQFTPNFAQYEVAKDSCRRAIQSSFGISPLPTAMQRDSQKSGVALERIQQSQAIGSFHFVDRFEMFMSLAGRVMNHWIDAVYHKEMALMLRRENGETYKAVINTAEPYIDEKDQEQHFKIGEGGHHITISTGPSDQSQREEITEFLNLLISNLQTLPIMPQQQAKLIGLMIRMKQMGPAGDEMADIIDPQTEKEQPQIPPEVLQQLQQLQAELQQLAVTSQEKDAELAELKQKIAGQVVDNEYEVKMTQMKIDADLIKAEMTAKANDLEQRLKIMEKLLQQLAKNNAEAPETSEE